MAISMGILGIKSAYVGAVPGGDTGVAYIRTDATREHIALHLPSMEAAQAVADAINAALEQPAERKADEKTEAA